MTQTIQAFDYNVDLEKAILWQYEEAVRIRTLLTEKQGWYDAEQAAFWTDWQRDMFDLRTANAFGLAVWSIILGQPIIFQNVSNPAEPTWGFGTYHKNFDRGNFASGSETYTLSIETARVVLRLRYYKLTGSCCVPDINRALKDILAENYGPAWLVDNHDMTQTYVFGFALPSDMNYVFTYFDVLPRPAGVGSTFTTSVEDRFAFGPTRQNFGHGNFSTT